MSQDSVSEQCDNWIMHEWKTRKFQEENIYDKVEFCENAEQI